LPTRAKKDVDGRDIRAFTPVFDGLLHGHDDAQCVAAGAMAVTFFQMRQ
jgi:hypothetical protein